MIRRLPLIPLATMLLSVTATPLRAQYIYTDVDGDSICTANDVLPMGADTVWVWLDTNHDAAGNGVSCPTGEPLTMSGYDVTIYLGSFGQGGHVSNPVGVGAWLNKMSQFAVDGGQVTQSGIQWVRVAYKSAEPPTYVTQGRHLLGGLPIEMPSSDCNVARIILGSLVGSGYSTGFASQCAGSDGDYNMTLGVDFEDTCAAADACLGVAPTTWGSIKSRYR